MNKALNDMTVTELRSLAKGLKIEGTSKLKKDELIDLIKQFAMATRRVRAQKPMSNEDRVAAYTRANNNGTAKLTVRQERQIRRMDRRVTGSTKKDIPRV